MNRSALGIVAMCVTLAACTGSDSETPRDPGHFSLIEQLDDATAEYDELRFRSVRKDGQLVQPITLEGRTELSLTPPVPSTLRYRVRVPESPVFRFATGIATTGESSLSSAVELTIIIDGEDDRVEVLSDVVRRRAANRWRNHDVDLSPWAGREIVLELSSRWRANRDVLQPVLASWGNPVVTDAGMDADRPTLVLISIDCLRADHVGAYGYEPSTTPFIDALAEDGVVFDRAFATASWTLPTHMSMLTGLLPSFHGATKWEKLSSSIEFLPERLARAGYRTAGVVSWVYLSQAYGFERGFHSYHVLDDPEASDIVDTAIEELGRGEGQPQFLFVHVYDPHWPYLPPSELMEAFGPRPRDISTLLEKTVSQDPPADALEVEEVKRLYDSEVAFADRELGRLFRALKERELYDNALIIVTADHGEAFYEHGHWQHSATLYDELIHVPLIVKFPGNAITGRSEALRSQTDVFVTLLETAGIDSVGASHGFLARHSLASEPSPDRTLLSELTWRSPNGTFMKVAFRDRDTKYVATLSGPAGDDLGVNHSLEEELYDLRADPDESTNLLPGAAPRAEVFRAQLETFLDEARAARSLRSGEAVELDADTKRKLEALGYVND